jgi:hypothetical protein
MRISGSSPTHCTSVDTACSASMRTRALLSLSPAAATCTSDPKCGRMYSPAHASVRVEGCRILAKKHTQPPCGPVALRVDQVGLLMLVSELLWADLHAAAGPLCAVCSETFVWQSHTPIDTFILVDLHSLTPKRGRQSMHQKSRCFMVLWVGDTPIVSVREHSSTRAVSRWASFELCVHWCSQGSSAGHSPAGTSVCEMVATTMDSARRTLVTGSADRASSSPTFRLSRACSAK